MCRHLEPHCCLCWHSTVSSCASPWGWCACGGCPHILKSVDGATCYLLGISLYQGQWFSSRSHGIRLKLGQTDTICYDHWSRWHWTQANMTSPGSSHIIRAVCLVGSLFVVIGANITDVLPCGCVCVCFGGVICSTFFFLMQWYTPLLRIKKKTRAGIGESGLG